MKRFTDHEIETLRLMQSSGYPATAIAEKLGRDPLSVRVKMVALGLPLRRRGKPRYGSRFLIPAALWEAVSAAAWARNMKPTKLCHMALAAISRRNLWDTLIDEPRELPPLHPRHTPHRVEASVDIPAATLAERDERLALDALYQPSLIAQWQGDPPPHRSALGQRPRSLGAAVPDEPIAAVELSRCYLAGRIVAAPEFTVVRVH
jgi:hypothetical protein